MNLTRSARAARAASPSGGSDGSKAPGPVRPIEPAAVRTRRRPLFVGLGAALVALGGLGAYAIVSSNGAGTIAVLAVTREVPAGQPIERADLVSVQVPTTSDLRAVPVANAREVIGKRTLVRLLPGSLINQAAVTAQLTPNAGQALVGVAVARTQMPATTLNGGDEILIVNAPENSTSAGNADAQPVSIKATVVSTEVSSPDGDGKNVVSSDDKTIVNVSVSQADAARVAVWGSAGTAAIVVLHQGS
jgi:hypothetical protein